MDTVKMPEGEQLLGYLNLITPYVIPLISAIIVLLIGWRVIKWVNLLVKKYFDRKDFEPSLESFVASLISILLKVVLLITVVGMVGVEMTSFIALLGGAGVAIGMALSGTLQNFTGGVLILFFKTYKVGDFIEAQGYSGTVKAIQIFNTILTTPDNKTIIIPNSPLSTDSLINYSVQPTRRVDWKFGISYDDDFEKAKEIIKRLMDEDNRILDDQDKFVKLGEFGDSSINLVCRAWVQKDDYWNVFFDMNEKVKKTFDQENVTFPYPHRQVIMSKEA